MSDQTLASLTDEQRAAVRELVEIKREHRKLRDEEPNLDAKKQRARFMENREAMDALRNREAEIINRFPNDVGPHVNDPPLHQRLHLAANFLLDMEA